jgi:hypothetical protein
MKDTPLPDSWVYQEATGRGLGQVLYGIGGGSGAVRVRFRSGEALVHMSVLREATAQEIGTVASRRP